MKSKISKILAGESVREIVSEEVDSYSIKLSKAAYKRYTNSLMKLDPSKQMNDTQVETIAKIISHYAEQELSNTIYRYATDGKWTSKDTWQFIIPVPDSVSDGEKTRIMLKLTKTLPSFVKDYIRNIELLNPEWVVGDGNNRDISIKVNGSKS